MELLDYIRKNYKTPNVAVLRTLGASEELIEYLCKTPWNTNMKVVESLIGEDSDESKQGLKSISISPVITTTPALDSVFPIYWGDTYPPAIHLTPNGVLPASAEITITPTDGWYVYNGETFGGSGEPVTISVENEDDGIYCRIIVTNDTESDEPEEIVSFVLSIE